MRKLVLPKTGKFQNIISGFSEVCNTSLFNKKNKIQFGTDSRICNIGLPKDQSNTT